MRSLTLIPSPAQRALRAVALFAVLLLAGCEAALYNKLSEQDANEIMAELHKAGISASKSAADEKTWRVEVASGDLAIALDALRAQGLPHERYANMGEVFRKEGLVSTPAEERVRFVYALSQEISHTLSQIDGVLVARVHVVLPANDPLNDKIKPSSAAVFIKHRPDADLQTLGPAIKNLVMGSIEGLAYDNISLSFFAAEAPLLVDRPATTTFLGIEVAPQSLVRLQAFIAGAAALVVLALGFVGLRYRSAITDDLGDWRGRLSRIESLTSSKSDRN
jgi:type III secretion protein J